MAAGDIATKFPNLAIGQPRTYEGTLSWDLDARVLKDMSVPNIIHRLDQAVPGAPILGFTNRVSGPKAVNQVIFFMIRTRRIRDYITLGGAYTTGTTLTIATADIGILKKGYHILNVHTREIMRITVEPTTTSVTVKRAVGQVSSANSNSTDDVFMILGYAAAEGDTKFIDLGRMPEVIFNYCQTLQDVYSITNYQAASKMTGDMTPQKKERLERLENMRMRLEKFAIMGQRSKHVNEDTKTVYTTNGLDPYTTENETDFGAAVTEAKLHAWAEQLGRFGPGTRVVMSSPALQRVVSLKAAGDRRLTQPVPNRFGVNITEYQGGPTRLMFFNHPLFFDDPGTTAHALNGSGYAVDFNDFGMVTQKGPKSGFFRWFANVQTPGQLVIEEQLIVDFGFDYAFPEHGGRAFNGAA